jgi:hypothetical protein
MYDLFLKAIIAHLLGDFVLQPKAWVVDREEKGIHSKALLYHLGVHFVLLLLLLGWEKWSLALLITLIHGVIDLTKVYFQKEGRQLWFFIDQSLHILSVMILTMNQSWVNIKDTLFASFSVSHCAAILFLTWPCATIIRVLLSLWADKIAADDGSNSLPNAGLYIGILERVLIYIFIVSGQLEAVGFLITAKSVFRFSDISQAKDRMLTEYILVGTLLSFGIATTVAIWVV